MTRRGSESWLLLVEDIFSVEDFDLRLKDLVGVLAWDRWFDLKNSMICRRHI